MCSIVVHQQQHHQDYRRRAACGAFVTLATCAAAWLACCWNALDKLALLGMLVVRPHCCLSVICKFQYYICDVYSANGIRVLEWVFRSGGVACPCRAGLERSEKVVGVCCWWNMRVRVSCACNVRHKLIMHPHRAPLPRHRLNVRAMIAAYNVPFGPLTMQYANALCAYCLSDTYYNDELVDTKLR